MSSCGPGQPLPKDPKAGLGGGRGAVQRQVGRRHRFVIVKRPSLIAAPHDCMEDIIPDMLPEYVPVIVWPSSDIWA